MPKSQSLTIGKKIRAQMTRMRLKPRLYDYCYLTTSNNLFVLKLATTETNNLPQPPIVLDIGCGNKPFVNLFSKQCQYTGLDISKDSQADIIHSLTTSLPFKDKTFDLVIISEALEHVPNPSFVLSESFRILKKNGLIFISTPFAFPIHGHPHDYYRYTEYFYLDIPKKQNAELILLRKSNSVFTSPIYTYMQILMPLPYIPNIAKKIIFFSMNTTIISIDFLLHKLSSHKRAKRFIESFPAGYAAVFRKEK